VAFTQSRSKLRAGQLGRALQVIYGDSALTEIYVLNRQSASLIDTTAQLEKQTDKQPVM
jgi:hypothetical protein